MRINDDILDHYDPISHLDFEEQYDSEYNEEEFRQFKLLNDEFKVINEWEIYEN